MPDIQQYRVQSVFDALKLLEVIVDADEPLNASELATRMGAQRNRIFRLLRTLEESGYIVQDSTTRAFRPSLKLISLGQVVNRKYDLFAVARPVMEDLRAKTDETVYLVAREGEEAVALLNYESNHLMRISAQPGRRFPLGPGATSQALLLTLSPPQLVSCLERQPQMQTRMHAIRERYLRDQVTFVDGRSDGLANEGVVAIATPVFDYSSRIWLALGIAWPRSRPADDYDALRAMLLDSAATLQRGLGGSFEAIDARIRELAIDDTDGKAPRSEDPDRLQSSLEVASGPAGYEG